MGCLGGNKTSRTNLTHLESNILDSCTGAVRKRYKACTTTLTHTTVVARLDCGLLPIMFMALRRLRVCKDRASLTPDRLLDPKTKTLES